MSHWKLETPVVCILFNRPRETVQVFEAIRKARPSKLFLIADGPRPDRSGEAERCQKARAIFDAVDWDCQVFKNYSDDNLGCRKRIGETGLPWVFDQVEDAIVLEDDCVPHPTFFRFCQELLEKYRHDERVMSISGTNLLQAWNADIQSYHFSQFFRSWGWASWRRVWQTYDVEMQAWPQPIMQKRIQEALDEEKQFQLHKKFFDRVYEGKANSWAYQMVYLGLSQSSFTIVPSRNLISNVGFDGSATNTSSTQDSRANIPTFEMKFPLVDPIGLTADKEFENKRFFKFFDRSLPAKISRKLNQWGFQK